MNPDLQSMSDWLRVKLLGEQVSRAHEWLGGMCYNCKIGKNSDAAQKPCPKGRYKPPPLLSAPEQYHRVIEAMREKGWESAMTQYTDNAIAQFHWSEGSGWFEDYLGGDTIGEAVVRAAFAALGGE